MLVGGGGFRHVYALLFRISDRGWRVEEDVRKAEALREMVSQRPDAKGLGGVVAGGDEVNPQLTRLRHHALGGLARDERLRARGGRLLDVVGARTGEDGHSPHTIGPGV